MSKGSEIKVTPLARAYAPAHGIMHDSEKYLMELEMPGLSKEDIDVWLTGKSMCVKSTGKNILYSVCYNFAHEVDTENAKAEYRDNVLHLELPFKDPIKTIKMKVR